MKLLHAILRPLGWVWRHPLTWVWNQLDTNTLRKVRDLFMIAAALSLVWVLVTILDLQNASRDRGLENQKTFGVINEIVTDVRDRQSPETARAQAAELAKVIKRIDCSQQQNNQDIIDLLVRNGIIEPGDTQALSEECLAFFGKEGK